MKRLTPEQQKLVRRLDKVEELSEKGEFEEARGILMSGREAARRDGLPHGTICWRLAITCDWMGDLEDAMRFMVEALEQDPLASPFRHSFAIISRRLRKALADEGRDPADPSTPRLYKLLVQQDEADPGAHLAMARWQLHSGETEAARALLHALTVLSPTFGPGWELRAEAERKLGRQEEVAECELQAKLCVMETGPLFSIPGEAKA